MEQSELIRKISLTTKNFGQMANRLERRNFMSQFFLIYYSIIGIINGLFPFYFDLSNNFSGVFLSFFDFWDIIIAIILLLFSSQIALFKYPERTKSCLKLLNELKALKSDLDTEGVDKIKSLYYQKISEIDFLFSRTDFYLSCIATDKKNAKDSEKEVDRHFAFLERVFINVKIFLEYFAYILLTISPVAMYVYIFLQLF